MDNVQTWLLHSTEDDFKAIGGSAEGDGERFVEFVLLEAAVKGIRDVGEIDGLACWRGVALCAGEHAGDSGNNFRGGMVEEAEILLMPESHRGFHDEGCYRAVWDITLVRVDASQPCCLTHDAACVGGIEHAHAESVCCCTLLDKVYQSLLFVEVSCVVGRKGCEGEAFHSDGHANLQCDELRGRQFVF